MEEEEGKVGKKREKELGGRGYSPGGRNGVTGACSTDSVSLYSSTMVEAPPPPPYIPASIIEPERCVCLLLSLSLFFLLFLSLPVSPERSLPFAQSLSINLILFNKEKVAVRSRLAARRGVCGGA